MIDGWLVIKPKRFSVEIAHLEIGRTIVVFAIVGVCGWGLKMFVPIYAVIVDLEKGKIIVANVIAGGEDSKRTHIFAMIVGLETKKLIAVN